MPFDPHRRAQFLIDEARIAGISHDDGVWMQKHVAACAECARYEETTRRVIGALNSFSFEPRQANLAHLRTARRPRKGWRMALAAAAVLVIAAVPIFKAGRDARQERADAVLLERVGSHVSRTVPLAMEPLMHPAAGERQ
jgi:hypothetical protein